MARPTLSNASSTTDTGFSITWAHTAESGKPIYAIIFPFNGADFSVGVETCTFGGAPMELKAKLWSTGGAVRFVLVYVLLNPTPGTDDIVFTSAYSTDKIGTAFNVTGGGVNGDVILPGMWNETAATLVKKGYAWEDAAQSAPGATQIICAQARLTHAPTITEGVDVVSDLGVIVKSIDTTDDLITFNCGRGGSGGDLTLFSFTIPPASDSLTSGTFQLVPTGSISLDSMGAGATPVFAGLPYGLAYQQGRLNNIIASAGTWHSWQINSNMPAGANNEVTVEIYRSGSSDGVSGAGTNYEIPTGIILTIGGASQQSNKADGINLTNYKYDRLSLRLTNTGVGALPTNFAVRATFLREPGIADEQIYGGGAKTFGIPAVDTEYEKATLHPMQAQWSNFPERDKSLIGIEGEFQEYLAEYQTATSVTDDHKYYHRLNGVLQDGSGGSIDTEAVLPTNTLGTSIARWQGSLPVIVGDFIANVGVVTSASSSQLRQAVTSLFKPSVSGQMLLSGMRASTVPALYYATFNASGGTNAEQDVEANVKIIIPPLTALGNSWRAKGLTNNLDGTAPGTGKSLQQDLRKNEANSGIAITLQDDDLDGTVGGDVEFVEDDSLDTLWTPTNSPSAARQFWTIPGVSAPTNEGTIIVTKNAGGNTSIDFDFTAAGGLSPGSFNLKGGEQEIFNNVPVGSGYGFTETPPSGWQQDSISVSNDSPIDNISVGDGEVVIVTFVNSLIEPANNPSGIYEMIPGKTNDTIWIDASLNVSHDVKIP